MSVWPVFLAGGLVTFLTRFSFIYAFGRFDVPRSLHRVLRFVPPAVLSAIIFPEVLMTSGRLDLSPSNPRMIAGAVATLVAFWTRKTLPTIAAGMAVLFAGLAALG